MPPNVALVAPVLKVCDAANINDDCNTNCWCPFGPGGAAQQCTAEGKCLSLVTSLAPMTNSEAPPFPDWQVRGSPTNLVGCLLAPGTPGLVC